jgi:phage I-like protein
VHASGRPEQKSSPFNSQGTVIEEINSKLTSLDKQIASLSNSSKAQESKEASDKYPISVYNDFKAMMSIIIDRGNIKVILKPPQRS